MYNGQWKVDDGQYKWTMDYGQWTAVLLVFFKSKNNITLVYMDLPDLLFFLNKTILPSAPLRGESPGEMGEGGGMRM